MPQRKPPTAQTRTQARYRRTDHRTATQRAEDLCDVHRAEQAANAEKRQELDRDSASSDVVAEIWVASPRDTTVSRRALDISPDELVLLYAGRPAHSTLISQNVSQVRQPLLLDDARNFRTGGQVNRYAKMTLAVRDPRG